MGLKKLIKTKKIEVVEEQYHVFYTLEHVKGAEWLLSEYMLDEGPSPTENDYNGFGLSGTLKMESKE